MMTLLFIFFLVLAVYFTHKYKALEDDFFNTLKEIDKDLYQKADVGNEDAIKQHFKRMRFFRKKQYLLIKDEIFNKKMHLLNYMDRISMIFIGLSFSIGGYKLFSYLELI